MIKRIIGNLYAVVVVVVIVFTAIGAGSYESMLSEDLFSSKSEPQVVEQPIAPNTATVDSAAVTESANEAQTEVSESTALEDEAIDATAETEDDESRE